MANSIADKYFLKATEELYCQVDQSLENLEYALSYESDHAPAHLLAGQIIADQLGDWDRAAEHYYDAMAIRPDDFATCLKVAWFWVNRMDLARAQKVVDHLKTLAFTKPEELHFIEARILERNGEVAAARKSIKQARIHNTMVYGESFLEAESKRLKAKEKLLNPKRKGKKKAPKRKKSDKKAKRK